MRKHLYAFESRRSSYIGPLAHVGRVVALSSSATYRDHPASGHFASYTLPQPEPAQNAETSDAAITDNRPLTAPFSSATFGYDGDGKRVKSVFNSTTTTYFVGNHYEVVAGASVTKYYYAGSQRIAMRVNGTLYYLLGDHPSTGSGQAWAPPA